MNTKLITNGKAHHRNLWFKASVVLGVLLGIVLLAQTVSTYYYVSRNLILRAAQRQIIQKTVALRMSLRASPARDAANLSVIAAGLQQESAGQIAWVRILDADGKPLAQSGSSTVTPFEPARIRQSLRQHKPLEQVVATPSGKLLVAVHWLALGRPGSIPSAVGRNAPPAALIVEMAIYLHTVAATFERLRASSIIGCSAALALLIAMIAIGLGFNRYLEAKQLAQELELAHRVQRELLPSIASAPRNLDFTGRCIPAWQVGGDFYDVFDVDHGRLVLVLGDIAGKGLPAALLSSLVQGAVRAVSWTLRSESLEEAVQELNDLLRLRTANERFASLFWCQYQSETSALRYVNAGHLPPMIVRRNLKGEFEVDSLEEGGPVLGLLPDATYRMGEALVRPGDLLVMFSDGITEATNANGEYFSEEELLRLVCENWERTPHEICDAVLEQMRFFLGDSPPQDDQSLLVARLKPMSSVSAASGAALVASSARTPGQLVE